MSLKEVHIELSDDFFALAEELLESDTYAKIATSDELLLVSLDHLIDAHLSYLGHWRAGRGGKVYNTETAKKKVKELMADVKIYRAIIKNEVNL